VSWDPDKHPPSDGLRSGRWKVSRQLLGQIPFGGRPRDVVVWVAEPIPRGPWAAPALRLERESFPNHRRALRYAIDRARAEQRAAHRHHTLTNPKEHP
jgi:hypothetical protein